MLVIRAMQWWPSGIEQNEDGPVREIPQRHVWASSIWITADGIMRRKWWNPVEKRWHWDAQPLPPTYDGYLRRGYHAPQFMTVERCICLAWRLRAPESTWKIDEVIRVRLIQDDMMSMSSDGGVNASTLRWAVEEEPDEDDIRNVKGETWRPLRWRVGAVAVPKGYSISSQGRLRDPRGRVTRGSLAFDRRWAAVVGAGLVDLSAAAGLDDGIALPLSIRQARGALLAGATPADLARHTGVTVGTAWSYFAQAATHVDAQTLRALVPPLVPPMLWRALLTLRGDGRIGGALSELDGLLRRVLPAKVMDGAHWMSQVRLGRMAVTA